DLQGPTAQYGETPPPASTHQPNLEFRLLWQATNLLRGSVCSDGLFLTTTELLIFIPVVIRVREYKRNLPNVFASVTFVDTKEESWLDPASERTGRRFFH